MKGNIHYHHTGLDTVRRTLRMVSRFTTALDNHESIDIPMLMDEYGLSRATVKRFIRLYREEVEPGLYFDYHLATYRRPNER